MSERPSIGLPHIAQTRGPRLRDFTVGGPADFLAGWAGSVSRVPSALVTVTAEAGAMS
ncbi:hypothetical protein [Streptomyces jumonjinensis]|uniref:hypothetical protein n=1 Tax=Streptomyces jumonjinensis TaxID=1945 RepID=UPI0012960B15|nr:hypothetical protein [Streptomyces jumonjinensis]